MDCHYILTLSMYRFAYLHVSEEKDVEINNTS